MKLKVLREYFDVIFDRKLKEGEIIEVDAERAEILLIHPANLVEKIEEVVKKEVEEPTAEEAFIEVETAVAKIDEKIETADIKPKKVAKKKPAKIKE
jgi:hypothetical protein